MTISFEIQAEVRTEHGTGPARRLRRKDMLPGVIYGAGKDPQSLAINHDKLQKSLKNEAFFSHILTVDVQGQKEKAVLKAVHRHPYKPRILHIDLQRISDKEKITMTVPLHFKGEEAAPGVKIKNGIVSHQQNSVEISCLPADLPEYIEIDVSKLDLDNAIHLSDLKLPKGVELIELAHGNDLPVVSIHLPRAAIEETEAPTPPPEVEAIKQKGAEEEAEGKKE